MRLRAAWIGLFTLLLAAPSGSLAAPTAAEERLSRNGAAALRQVSDPATVLALHRLYDLRDRLPDDLGLAQLLAEVAAAPTSHPLVRAHARLLAARLARLSGDLEQEAALLDRLGLTREFQVIGPFDDEGRTGFPRRDPPEATGFAAAAEYPGKERPVAWHAFPRVLTPGGRIALEDHLVPAEAACAYLATAARVDEPGAAALRVGASGSVAAWVGGVLVLAREDKHPARLDQAVVPVRLGAAWTPLLLEVCAGDGWSALVRLTRPDGRPLPGLRFSADPAVLVALGPTDRGVDAVTRPFARTLEAGAEPPADLHEILAARAAADQPSATDLLDLADVLTRFAPVDRDEELEVRAAETALALAGERADLLLYASQFFRDPNRARGVLDLALAADPDNPDVLVALAAQARGRERLFDAARLARQALDRRPGDLRATVVLSQIFERVGLPAAGLAGLRRLSDRQRATALAARQELLRAEALGLGTWADAAAERLEARHPDDTLALRRLLGRDRARSDLDAAVGRFTARLARQPGRRGLRLELASLLDANDRTAEAAAALERARALAPEAAEVHEARGHFLRRQGRPAEALAVFRESLRLRPQNPELIEYVAHLSPEAEDFFEPYVAPAADLAAAARGGALGGEDAVAVLAEVRVTRVHPNGLAGRFHQRVVRVLTPRGAEDQRRQVFRFSPGNQRLKVLAARIFRADGGVDQTTTTYERSLSDPAHRLYYDVRAKVVELPELRPGDVVEIRTLLSDQGENLFADQFGEVTLLQRTAPVHQTEYALIAPAARELFVGPLPAGVEHSTEVRGAEQILRFAARDLPALRPEPRMPGLVEVAQLIHVSTSDSWEALGRWYGGLIQDQFAPDDEIRRAVARLTEGLTDTRDKVEAIHGFVVRKTRYVGLEFGLHSYKPYAAAKVFARGFGDCKDKATLLSTMLGLAGVDSRLVALRTRPLGRLPEQPASLAALNHAILYVPELDLYVDATAESSGLDELPAVDQGVDVLLVEPGGEARRARSPIFDAADSSTENLRTVDLAADGTARVTGRTVVRGQSAPRYRELFESAAERRERFEKMVAEDLPGVRVTALEFSDLTDLRRPVEFSYTFEAPRYAVRRDRELTLLPGGRPSEYGKSLASLSRRRHDLVLSAPFRTRTVEVLRVPAGGAIELPVAGEVSTPFGRASFFVREQGADTVELIQELQLDVRRVAAADYPAFRRFCRDVDRLLGSRVRVTLPPEGGAR